MLKFFRKQKPLAPEPELARAEVPVLRGAEIAAFFYGQRMAGDYYDFLRVNPSRVLFGLLDVAGRRRRLFAARGRDSLRRWMSMKRTR
jgi:serine phosphatase RsbU (regulator of sigma subunit)